MKLKQYVKNKINRTILSPTDALLDSNLLTITTTVGDFIIKKIQDKLFRIVTFTVSGYQNEWMENALYNILYKYNIYLYDIYFHHIILCSMFFYFSLWNL